MHTLYTAAALALAALPLSAGAASARDFSAPEGCEVFLTVQARECGVSNLYRCEAEPKGNFWEAFFTDSGLESLVGYDAQYQWLDARYAWDNSREVLNAPAKDPIDLNALLSEGVDTYHFTLHRTAPGEERDVTVLGADVLTTDTVEIDGKALAVIATDLQILDEEGAVEYQSRGRQYFDREARLFFIGPEDVTGTDGEVTQYDGSPVDFIYPGEPGFGATIPLYECDQLKASFSGGVQ